MTKPMTLDEFKDKVDLYSSDLSQWPQEMVKPAIAFMKENKEAADYFDGTLLLDAKLREYEPVAMNVSALENRIMLRIVGEKQEEKAAAPLPVEIPATAVTVTQFRKTWLFAPGGGLLAIALLGFFLGFTPPQKQVVTPLDPAYVAEEQLASIDADIDDGIDGEVF